MSEILDRHREKFFTTTVDLSDFIKGIESLTRDDPLELENSNLLSKYFSNPTIQRIRLEIMRNFQSALGQSPIVQALLDHPSDLAKNFPYDVPSDVRDAFDENMTSLVDTAVRKFLQTLTGAEMSVLTQEADRANADSVVYFVADYYCPNIAPN